MEQGEPALVKSMTGYGRGEAVVHGRSITVELRSVNNRYLDCTIKLPREIWACTLDLMASSANT